jgi:hypothetical protein
LHTKLSRAIDVELSFLTTSVEHIIDTFAQARIVGSFGYFYYLCYNSNLEIKSKAIYIIYL